MSKSESVAGFGDRLRAKIEELGISHSEAAQKLGLTRGTLSNYLNGRSEPGLYGLVFLSKILDTTPNYLLDVPDEPPMPDTVFSLEPAALAERILALEQHATKTDEEVSKLKGSLAKKVNKRPKSQPSD